jgi:catechol-2,3-dioxygenase
VRHIALNVDSMEELDEWKAHFAAKGVETVGIVDHDGVWESLYLFDPNGIRLELTFQTRPLDDADARAGAETLRKWTARG